MNLINKAKASFEARIIQPNMQKNFEKTSYGKKLAAYKDAYKERQCFLIGNSPSLKADDLTKFHNNNEVTFCFNIVYNIFDKTKLML